MIAENLSTASDDGPIESPSTIKQIEDYASTAALLMLYPAGALSQEGGSVKYLSSRANPKKAVRGDKVYTDIGRAIGASPQKPKDALTIFDQDRIFTDDADQLLRHPSSILGDRSELIFCGEVDGEVKWNCAIKKKRPSSVLPAWGGATHSYYELHTMVGDENGWREYQCRPVLFRESGHSVPVKLSGLNGVVDDGYKLLLMASIIEDANSENMIMASISIEGKIRFPLNKEDYKSFFSDRDGLKETATGRRNPILHIVSSHMRKTGDKLREVSTHSRGVREFETGGMIVRIEGGID